MKRIKIVVTVIVLLIIIIACDIGPISIDLGLGGDGDSAQPEGGAVEAGIDSPSNGAALPMGPVEIAYHATSTEGVSVIELSVNGEVVNSFTNPDSDQNVLVMKYTWEPNVSGNHTIRVRAQNSEGTWSDFSTATVNIEDEGQIQQQDPPTESETPKETDTPSPTATPEEMTIFNIEQSLDKFYYGDGTCGSREVTISADITHPDDAFAAIAGRKSIPPEPSIFEEPSTFPPPPIEGQADQQPFALVAQDQVRGVPGRIVQIVHPALDHVGVNGSDDAAGDAVKDEHRRRNGDARHEPDVGEDRGSVQNTLQDHRHGENLGGKVSHHSEEDREGGEETRGLAVVANRHRVGQRDRVEDPGKKPQPFAHQEVDDGVSRDAGHDHPHRAHAE